MDLCYLCDKLSNISETVHAIAYVCMQHIYKVVYDISVYLRGRPFDTQWGGGLCKFSKKIIWLSLIKKKIIWLPCS